MARRPRRHAERLRRRAAEAASALRGHWPEYLMEAAGLGTFMVAACLFSILLFHPAAPRPAALDAPLAARAAMGAAMGLTAIALVYSPWGRRSGAHMNPCMTLAFLRLGRVAGWDAVFYVVAQCAGGVAGVLLASAIAPGAVAHPAVRWAVTRPGPQGLAVAFAAEAAISALLMATVLAMSGSQRLERATGIACGALVALYIAFESPLSGMSMNPARSLASALPAGEWRGFWIYSTAPLLGMLGAAELGRRVRGPLAGGCAKLRHASGQRCIFCGAGMPAEPPPAVAAARGGAAAAWR